MESILTSIKKMLGITAEYEHFDADIIMHINSVFFTLNQIGIGPEKSFRIEDDSATWNQFLMESTDYEAVKSYIYLKVKLLFDPPINAAVIENINKTIQEYEWRLNVAAEPS